ncbi:MAG: copper chaperone [Pseudonocardiales bacterium]|jgi:copper chaperone CopZ|nr:copper chaperone [Pseudonocardiales bacterium]
MSIQNFPVTGMTCEHCVAAVRSELGALAGVTDVSVDLDANATSTVTVTASEALTDEQVAAALDEAGAYELARGV